MSRRTGIQAASDGKTLLDEPLAYSSEKTHLVVDTAPGKDRLKIVTMNAGALINLSTAAPGVTRVIFHTIPHKQKFIPKVSVRFLARTVPAVMSGFEGQYSSYLYIGGIPFYEAILFRVDETNVYFIHEGGAIFVSPTQTYATVMQEMLLQIKYMIFENEGLDEPYEAVFNVA